MKRRRFLLTFVTVFMLTVILSACAANEPAPTETPAPVEKKEIILSTTTSTQDSGLLDYLLPIFTEDTGYEIKVVAVGTGQAIKMGEDGEADVLLVHAKTSEEEFVKAGHGIKRYDVMYNDFILVGPKDEVKVKDNSKGKVLAALKYINDSKIKFISRGDDSGTHKAELKLWKAAVVEPAGDWYISAGKGMGAVIQMADEMKAYTLTDRATYLSMRDKVNLDITVEQDPALYNQYGVIAVNPDKNDKINSEGAEAFVDWILSEKVQMLIGEFGVEEFGQSLFIPNASK
ncbi:MAG: extracellular solute-binding protein [Clostridia bacterium]|jgi:tungstate transport system substrate-binding protein|nr:extracellular solute-binding protein [Clostridia bacterium]